ncbi:MAG TPA: hypothetical protein VGA31_13740 [Thermoanaerobaculia bacterium]
MNRRLFSLLAFAVVLTLTAGIGRGQKRDVSPTPVPTPPPPEAAPAPAPPPEPTPAPPTALPAVPTSAVPPAAATPTPPAAAVTPTSPPAMRITDSAVVAILQAPAENPFGITAEVPAALPPKLNFAQSIVPAAQYVSARVDAAGKPMGLKPERDPIPSLSGEAQKSLARWTFEPARRGSENVETWAALRLDLQVEIDAPRSVQANLVPVTPSTAIPRPLSWPSDETWLETRKGPAPAGGVAIDAVDSPPMPKKTPWTADSYRGPFSARFWVKVRSNGSVEKAIPLEATDPILLGYLRHAMSTWTFRPAQAHGMPVDSWNELSLSGNVTYKVALKQIASLRRSLAGS